MTDKTDYFDDIDDQFFMEMENWSGSNTQFVEHYMYQDHQGLHLGATLVEDGYVKDLSIDGDVELNPGWMMKDQRPIGDWADAVEEEEREEALKNKEDTTEKEVPTSASTDDKGSTPTVVKQEKEEDATEKEAPTTASTDDKGSKPAVVKVSSVTPVAASAKADPAKELADRCAAAIIEMEQISQRDKLLPTKEMLELFTKCYKNTEDPTLLVKKYKELAKAQRETDQKVHAANYDKYKTAVDPPKFQGRCHNCHQMGHMARHCKTKSTWKPRQAKAGDLISKSFQDHLAQIAGEKDALKETIAELRAEKEEREEQENEEAQEYDEEPEVEIHAPMHNHGDEENYPPEFHVDLTARARLWNINWNKRDEECFPSIGFIAALAAGAYSLVTNILRLQPPAWRVMKYFVAHLPSAIEEDYFNERYIAVAQLTTEILSDDQAALPVAKQLCKSIGRPFEYGVLARLADMPWSYVLRASAMGLVGFVTADLAAAWWNNRTPHVRNNKFVNYFLGPPQRCYSCKFVEWEANPYLPGPDARPDLNGTAAIKHRNPLLASLEVDEVVWFWRRRARRFSAYMEVVMQAATFGNIHLGMDDATSSGKTSSTLTRLGTVNYNRSDNITDDAPLHHTYEVCGWVRESMKTHSLYQDFPNCGGFVPSLLASDTEKSNSPRSQTLKKAHAFENCLFYCLVAPLSVLALALTFAKLHSFIRTQETEIRCLRELVSDLPQRCQTLTLDLPMTSNDLFGTFVRNVSFLYSRTMTLASRIGLSTLITPKQEKMSLLQYTHNLGTKLFTIRSSNE